MTEKVEPFVDANLDHPDRLKKLENQIRSLASGSEDKRLDELETQMQNIDTVIQKHTFY